MAELREPTSMEQTTNLLEIRHLKKAYCDETVLRDLSLTVHKGEVVVAVGPSGCGKSTLLRCINGLEPIQGGQILLNGQVITDCKTQWSRIRQKIGMVFQSYDLFPHMTVLENVLLGPTKVQGRRKDEAASNARKLLQRVGLQDKTDAYPRQLSGGQKQRVAIVRALMMEPEMMLLDEITAALDPEMVREVLDVVLELAKSGMTMMIVTHEMQFAKAIADRVIFVDSGEIVESDTPEAFFTQPKTERARKFLNIFSFEKSKEEYLHETV